MDDVHFSSATDQWSTPQALFDGLNQAFGFELDVCAGEGNAISARSKMALRRSGRAGAG